MKKQVLLGALLLLMAAPQAAEAGPKPWVFGWWPAHWDGLDYNPYLDPAKDPHNTQWDDRGWTEKDWQPNRDAAMQKMHDFYRAEIITAQYQKKGVPVLEVGPGFYRLGGEDKRKVTAFVNDLYGITYAKKDGMYLLKDHNSGQVVGLYTSYGLQIQ